MKSPARPDLCPRFHFAIELIGRRWSGAILYLLLQAPARFVDLREGIPGITDPMLAQRLRELEAAGMLDRTVLPGTPVRVQYALTPKGRGLGEVMRAIGEWGHAWVPAPKVASASGSRKRTARAS